MLFCFPAVHDPILKGLWPTSWKTLFYETFKWLLLPVELKKISNVHHFQWKWEYFQPKVNISVEKMTDWSSGTQCLLAHRPAEGRSREVTLEQEGTGWHCRVKNSPLQVSRPPQQRSLVQQDRWVLHFVSTCPLNSCNSPVFMKDRI